MASEDIEFTFFKPRGLFKKTLGKGTHYALAVMQRNKIDLDTGIVSHFRNTTDVEGKFWIPPDLVALPRTEWSKVDSPLAFVTRDGHSLVR